jgi:hypothetical protein
MRYLSPNLLFGETLRPPFDTKIIQRERKKLLAELELSGGDSLELNGQSFTKNEILGYFEELQREDIMTYHLVVSEDPVLLRFLSDGAIDERAYFKDADIYQDPGFINWLSPYFRSTFTKFVMDCFELTDATSMRALLDNKLLMTVQDKEQSWLSIAGVLEKNIALFDHYKDRCQRNSPKMMPIERVSAFLGHGYIEVIKQLPNNRFAHLKDAYAFSMQHPAIATFNRDKRNRHLSVVWVEDAWDLAVSADLKARISAKLNELNGILKKAKKRAPWGVIWGVVVLARVIGSLISSNSSEHLNSGSAPVFVTQPGELPLKLDSSTIKSFDSLFKKAHKRDTGGLR